MKWPTPEVIGILSVKEMFEQLKGDMQILKTKMEDMEKKQVKEVSQNIVEQCKNDIVKAMDITLQQDKDEFKKMRQDLKHFKFRNRVLMNTVDSMSTKISDLKARIDNLELSGSKNAITISGFSVSEKKYEAAAQIEDMIETQIGVQISIDDLYINGQDTSKLIIVYLQNAQQKRDVMRFKSYLKGFTSNGRNVYINDYLPATTVERRKREGDIFRLNDQKQQPAQMAYKKGKIIIQGELYIPKVTPPTPRQLIDVSTADLDRILKNKLLVQSITSSIISKMSNMIYQIKKARSLAQW